MNAEFTDYVSSEIPTIENENIEYVNDQSNEIPSAKSVSFSYHFLPCKRGFKLAALNVNKLSTHIDELKILLGENPMRQSLTTLLVITRFIYRAMKLFDAIEQVVEVAVFAFIYVQA